MGATEDRLTGARVLTAKREPPWLVLVTDQGEVHVAGGRVRLDLRCNRCGEERLVEIVKDARGEQAYCAVCATSWKLEQAKAG